MDKNSLGKNFQVWRRRRRRSIDACVRFDKHAIDVFNRDRQSNPIRFDELLAWTRISFFRRKKMFQKIEFSSRCCCSSVVSWHGFREMKSLAPFVRSFWTSRRRCWCRLHLLLLLLQKFLQARHFTAKKRRWRNTKILERKTWVDFNLVRWRVLDTLKDCLSFLERSSLVVLFCICALLLNKGCVLWLCAWRREFDPHALPIIL